MRRKKFIIIMSILTIIMLITCTISFAVQNTVEGSNSDSDTTASNEDNSRVVTRDDVSNLADEENVNSSSENRNENNSVENVTHTNDPWESVSDGDSQDNTNTTNSNNEDSTSNTANESIDNNSNTANITNEVNNSTNSTNNTTSISNTSNATNTTNNSRTKNKSNNNTVVNESILNTRMADPAYDDAANESADITDDVAQKYIYDKSKQSVPDNVPVINSAAAYLIDPVTGKIFYEKNADEKMYPADLTKIMTCLLALENCTLDELATVTQYDIDLIPQGYKVANLQAGESMTIRDLLYAMMLPSANEVANVLANHISGGIDKFAKLMNQRATQLGCENTNFVNPSGIHNENQYSTAYDLYLIANEAMKNETFREIVKTTNYTLSSSNKYAGSDRLLNNTNELINKNDRRGSDNYYYPNAIGIKTGYSDKARNCLVSAASKNNLNLICVVLGANGSDNETNESFKDTISLYNFAYDNYGINTVIPKNKIVKNITVENASRDTKDLNLIASQEITALSPNNLTADKLKPEITLNDNILAPIEAGQKLGKAVYNVDGLEYTIDLVAQTNVEEQADITMYLLIAGGVLLFFGFLLILPKKKKKRQDFKNANKNNFKVD